MQQPPPPAWYPDARWPGQLRWFDGSQWTDSWSPVPGASTSTPDGPGSLVHWMVPVGRSWQSIVAGYLGLFSIVVLPLGPLAIGFGAWGLRVASRAGVHGRGRCWFGIAAGVWGVVALGLVVALT